MNRATVGNLISDNGVAQLSDEIGKRLAVLDSESDVSRTAARLGLDRGQGSHPERVGVERIEADDIGSKVRDEEELARGVEDRLVRVRRVLLGIGTRRVGELDGLDILDLGRVGNVIGGKCRTTAASKKKAKKSAEAIHASFPKT